MSRRFTRRSIMAGLGAIAALPILAACQPQIIEVEKVQVVEKRRAGRKGRNSDHREAN